MDNILSNKNQIPRADTLLQPTTEMTPNERERSLFNLTESFNPY